MSAFIKSVEYVEITLTGSTAVSVNLTKSQTIADCVPFYTVNLASTDDINNRRYVEVFFEAGPKVTARRDGSTGTVIVGIFVVEFDTSGDISVEQGTFSFGSATATITQAITSVTTTKAFCVISYRAGADTDRWDHAHIRVQFNSGTQLGLRRSTASGTIAGRYYVVSTIGADFSVQHTTISPGSIDETATTSITSITTSKTFIYSTYRTSEGADDVRDGSWVVDLQDATTVRVRRAFNSFGGSPGVASTLSEHEAQVITAGDTEFSVERAECDWGDSLTKAVTITEIDQTKAIVVAGGYQGTMNANETAGADLDGNYAVLDFTSNTEVTGTRATNTDPDGTTFFEVVEFVLTSVGGPNIVVPLGTFSIVGQVPTIETGVNVPVPLKTFTRIGFPPTITAGAVIINVPLGTFTKTGFVPIISIGVNIVSPLGTFTLTSFIPSIQTGVTIITPLGTFTLTEFIPSINIGVNVITPLGTFILTKFIPTIETGVTIITPLGIFTLTGFAPSIQAGEVNIIVPLDTFTKIGFVPNISIGVNIITPLGTFTHTGFIPTINIGVNIITPLETFNLTSFIPTIQTGVTIITPLGSFTVNFIVPAVASGVGVGVPLKTFSLTKFIPSIQTDVTIIAPLGSFIRTGFIPTIEATEDTVIIVPLKIFIRTGFIPTIHAVDKAKKELTEIDLTPPFEDITQMRYLFRNFALLRDVLETGVTGQFTTTDGKTIHIRNGVVVDIF